MQANHNMTGLYIGAADYRTLGGKGGFVLNHAKGFKTQPFCAWTGGAKVLCPTYRSHLRMHAVHMAQILRWVKPLHCDILARHVLHAHSSVART